MSTENSPDPADDFGADDFDVEIYYPYAPPQQWVILAASATAEQVAVYTFMMAHLNPHDGKFDAHFGRNRIAERFSKSLDWVDKQLKGLAALGAMSKVPTYWIDAKDHSKGRSLEATTDQGKKRSQAPNRYRVKMAPPGGALFTGPIKIAEFYKPDKIRARIRAAKKAGNIHPEQPDHPPVDNPPADDVDDEPAGDGGAAEERPPSDQPIVDNSGHVSAADTDNGETPGQGGAATQRPGGGRHTAAGGGRHTAAQKNTGTKEHGEKKKHGEPFTESGDPSPEPPVPAADAAGSKQPGHLAYGVTTELEFKLDPDYARARKNAGPVACAAIDTNPDIELAELEKIISGWNRDLTQAQVVSRAAKLDAFAQLERRNTPGFTQDPKRRTPPIHAIRDPQPRITRRTG